MVDSAAAVPGCAWPVDAGACTPKGDRGSATSPFRRVRPCAAGRVQTGAGVAGSTIRPPEGGSDVRPLPLRRNQHSVDTGCRRRMESTTPEESRCAV
jgi:hypothetical protein